MPTRSVFWAYLGVCALALAAITVIPETVRHPDQVISVRPRLGIPPGMRAVMAGRAWACSPRSVSSGRSAAWCPPSCTGYSACTTLP